MNDEHTRSIPDSLRIRLSNFTNGTQMAEDTEKGEPTRKESGESSSSASSETQTRAEEHFRDEVRGDSKAATASPYTRESERSQNENRAEKSANLVKDKVLPELSIDDHKGDVQAKPENPAHGEKSKLLTESLLPKSESAAALNPGDQDLDRVADHIEKHKEDVDYKKMWDKDTRLMAIGDFSDHGLGKASKEEFIKSITQMKDMKPPVKHVGFEFLPEKLDTKDGGDFLKLRSEAKDGGKDPSSDEKIKEQREKLVDYLAKGLGSKESADRYVKMMEAAQDAGAKVVGLEPSWSQEQFASAKEATEKLREENPELLKKFAESDKSSQDESSKELSDHLKEKYGDERAKEMMDALKYLKETGYDFKTLLSDSSKKFEDLTDTWRSKVWAAQIDKALKDDPSSRMVVFGGGGHFGHDGKGLGKASTVMDELPQYKSVVVALSGGDNPTSPPEGYPRDRFETDQKEDPNIASKAAKKVGLERERFMFRYRPQGPRLADWIVHTPRR
ncbi:MAG: hypothetical protein K2X77_30550 [Candidatus Obscuribacterales bacterium]|nr:hypothetical protein [Candidatus Obscuribacterales bacterium]